MTHTGNLIKLGRTNVADPASVKRNIANQQGVADRFTGFIAKEQTILDNTASTIKQRAAARQAISAFTRQRGVVETTIGKFQAALGGFAGGDPEFTFTPGQRFPLGTPGQGLIRGPARPGQGGLIRGPAVPGQGGLIPAGQGGARGALGTAAFGPEPGVSGSIVDFLKSKGIDSSFGSRAFLFKLLGQTEEFRGTAEQNLGLLGTFSRLESEARVPLTKRNILDVIKGFGGGAGAPRGDTQVGDTDVSIPTGDRDRDFGGLADTARGGGLPSEGDLSAQASLDFLGSKAFELSQRESDAREAQLKIQQEQDRTALLQDFARRGIAFSGIREKGEATQEESQRLAETLGIEIPLAKVVLEGIAEKSKALLKDALDEKKDAVDFFKSLGLVVNPETGELVQTSAETRAQASATRQEAKFQQEQEVGKKIDTFTDIDGRRIEVFQTPDGAIRTVVVGQASKSEKDKAAEKSVYTNTQLIKIRKWNTSHPTQIIPTDRLSDVADILITDGEDEAEKFIRNRNIGIRGSDSQGFIGAAFEEAFNRIKNFAGVD